MANIAKFKAGDVVVVRFNYSNNSSLHGLSWVGVIDDADNDAYYVKFPGRAISSHSGGDTGIDAWQWCDYDIIRLATTLEKLIYG